MRIAGNNELTANRAKTILDKYGTHFRKIDAELTRGLSSRVDLVKEIGNHTVLGKGKRLRPLFFVLSCRLCGYAGKDVYRLSTIFEYIHASSLLHDDVLDNADTRRRKSSANRLWGNHAAVLEGDFLYSKALSISLETDDIPFVRRVTDTTLKMTEGQILELVHTDDWDIPKDIYLEIITAKTAVLISAACACGALISGAESQVTRALEGFGLYMGIAFQLMDDLLDYTARKETFGKPVGKDLREGKVTLPLIYTLASLDASRRRELEISFRGRSATEADYDKLIRVVKENGALSRVQEEARSYVDRAAACLESFEDSPVKQDLLQLNRFVVERPY